MPFAPLEGVRRGCRAIVTSVAGAVRPSAGWLGRVVNALGEPIDGKGPLLLGAVALSVPQHAAAGACAPPRRRAARSRRARAQYLHHLLPRPAHGHLLRLRRRQIGAAVDAGAQRRRPTSRDRTVGERGREVQEFLQDDLGEAGLARSVVVVSTSDEPALMRRQAAHVTLAIAEYFRDEARTCWC